MNTKTKFRNPTRGWSGCPVFLIAAVLYASAASIQSQSDWCGTQNLFEHKIKVEPAASAAPHGICPQQGECDDPTMRNHYFSGARIKLVRLFVQVLCDDSGNNCAANVSDVAVQLDSLNQDFSATGIQFVYGMRSIISTRFRYLAGFSEAELMKSTFAVAPDRQINVFVTQNGFCTCSYATYPWDPAALTAGGGIVMTRERFYPQSVAASTLTHEVGHVLGLWHTHHGVSEVPPCSDCYESVNAGNRDNSGDFCEDTDPTPSNTTCDAPLGIDNCSGSPWGTTDYHNYMGYAPDPCLSAFSPEQVTRMHCWTESNMNSVMLASMRCDTLFGAAPFEVNAGATYGGEALSWRWDFGDSTSSPLQDPAHLFTKGGRFDLKCYVDTDTGQYTIRGLPPIYVTSETLVVASAIVDTNVSARIEIRVNNRVPLTKIAIPFTWSGPFNLTFDSLSTAGLRTSDLNTANGGIAVTNKQLGLQRMALELRPDSRSPIAIGSGPILALYFHTPSRTIAGGNPVQITSYDTLVPRLCTIPGDYAPYIVNGSISLTCCEGETGNIDGDPSGVVDISDLSFLIAHLFIDYRPLWCPAEANIDGDPEGVIDISDLTRLIDFLYINFTAPANCR